MADFNDRFAPAMPGVDFAGRLAMASQGQQPGMIQDMRGQPDAYQAGISNLIQRFLGNASRKLVPPGLGGPAAPGSLGAQAGYNDLGSTEGHSVVQRFLKAMHKSPVVSGQGSQGDSGFIGGYGNY